jgi:hypothetical protein
MAKLEPDDAPALVCKDSLCCFRAASLEHAREILKHRARQFFSTSDASTPV